MAATASSTRSRGAAARRRAPRSSRAADRRLPAVWPQRTRSTPKARLEFGGLEQVKEDCRDVRGTRWLDESSRTCATDSGCSGRAPPSRSWLWRRSRSDWRQQRDLRARRRRPEVTAGSGSAAADPARRRVLDQSIWEQIRARHSEISDGAAAVGDVRFDLSRAGATEFVEGLWTSGNFFDVLGVPAVLGRTFTMADDDRGGGPDGPVAVISAFWQRRFGEASVIGQLTLDRTPFTIVGVTPPSFLDPARGVRSTSRCRSARRRSQGPATGSTPVRPGCCRSWRG